MVTTIWTATSTLIQLGMSAPKAGVADRDDRMRVTTMAQNAARRFERQTSAAQTQVIRPSSSPMIKMNNGGPPDPTGTKVKMMSSRPSTKATMRPALKVELEFTALPLERAGANLQSKPSQVQTNARTSPLRYGLQTVRVRRGRVLPRQEGRPSGHPPGLSLGRCHNSARS